MFSLTVIDHVRLDSERVAQNYTVHAAAAERIVRLITIFRISLVVFLAAAASAEIATIMFPRGLSPATAVAAGMAALVWFSIYGALGLESRLCAHRLFAHRLWAVAERYRLLLAEVNDNIVDGPMLLARRNELVGELDSIYQFAFGVDHAAYESLRLPPVPHERAA